MAKVSQQPTPGEATPGEATPGQTTPGEPTPGKSKIPQIVKSSGPRHVSSPIKISIVE